MKRPHDNDDIWSAIEYNPPHSFHPEDILDIVAEIPGEDDELNWWWILHLRQGYALVSAWCDYTGWDCQSGLVEHGIFVTKIAAATNAPPDEDVSRRTIRKNLIAQVKGFQPLYIYQK